MCNREIKSKDCKLMKFLIPYSVFLILTPCPKTSVKC